MPDFQWLISSREADTNFVRNAQLFKGNIYFFPGAHTKALFPCRTGLPSCCFFLHTKPYVYRRVYKRKASPRKTRKVGLSTHDAEFQPTYLGCKALCLTGSFNCPSYKKSVLICIPCQCFPGSPINVQHTPNPMLFPKPDCPLHTICTNVLYH